MIRHKVQTGMTFTRTFQVREEWLANRMGSGHVAVLATPALVIAMENLAASSIMQHLREGSTSVGSRVDIVHLAPTPAGARFSIELVVSKVEKNRIEFVMTAKDEKRTIATGFHRRHVVDESEFLLSAMEDSMEPPPPPETPAGTEPHKTQGATKLPFDDGDTRA